MEDVEERSTNQRASGVRPKKRKFTGNRYTATTNKKRYHSSSFKKLNSDDILPPKDDDSLEANFDGYRIFDLKILCEIIEESLCCRVCQGNVKLNEMHYHGLTSKFELCCLQCSYKRTFTNTSMLGVRKNASELNKRFTYAMRILGHGRAGMQKFCCVMDLPPVTADCSYNANVKEILSATSTAAENSMKKAAQSEAILSNSSLNVTVSGDGTWKTRGHTSLIGVCSVIGSESGKVLDTEVLSKYCKGCASSNEIDSTHIKDCLKNHVGSSGKMESDGMVNIFSHSEEKRGVKYTAYIGDGDSKTFTAVCESKPYGDSIDIKKIECVGHIQKRMGTRLRKLKIEKKKIKLSDGKPLSGKGRLTDKLVNEITSYYGNAIREHKDSLIDMRKAIWAIYHHKISTDENHMHDFCPADPGTWCKYNKSVQTKTNYSHKSSVPAAVMEAMKPIFKDLSQPTLLKRCLGGKTQNNNESFNALIWRFCPKISGAGRRIVEIATNEAVISFNEGFVGRHIIMNELNFLRSKFSIEGFLKLDTDRIANAEKKCLLESKEQRKLKRKQKAAEVEMSIKNHGETYFAGGF